MPISRLALTCLAAALAGCGSGAAVSADAGIPTLNGTVDPLLPDLGSVVSDLPDLPLLGGSSGGGAGSGGSSSGGTSGGTSSGGTTPGGTSSGGTSSGGGSSSGGGTATQTLDPDLPPSANFDLSRWYLTLPSGSTVSVDTLNDGYEKAETFETDAASGGMVVRCPNIAGTTANSHYSRTELREMRAGTGSAKDDANNWTMDEGGTLTATLRVDQVSTTGDSGKIGRVIIGQIHGYDSEPIRLYYDKDLDEDAGRIYAGLDTASNGSSFSRDIVSNANGGGIELGETFQYRIRLKDRNLTVRITRQDGTVHDFAYTIDAAYAGENLYFKAGVYNQNNTGAADDYVQATFFALDVTHP